MYPLLKYYAEITFVQHKLVHTWQDAQGPWGSSWSFVRRNRHSFIDTGNVDEVTHFQSAIFKVWIAIKRNSLYVHLITMLSVRFAWNCFLGKQQLLKIWISGILQSAMNDPKLNSNDLTRKAPYIWNSLDSKSQIFICFSLQAAFSRYCTCYDFPIDPH